MIRARLIHNAEAGAGASHHDRQELLSLLAAEGYDCRYSSTKDDWQHLDPDIELVIVAGGDGTVRKVAGWMAGRPPDQRRPVAILPFGTANNLARALHINGDIHTLIKSWAHGHRKKFDIGRVSGAPSGSFFMEGTGFGIFPQLMKEMNSRGMPGMDTPEKRMDTAFRTLHRIISSFQPVPCRLELDGQLHEGRFMLAEVLNIPFIGPNLCLAAHADPGDGELDIVMVQESDRDLLADYILHKMSGTNTSHGLHTMKAKNISLLDHGPAFHVDDEVMEIDPSCPIYIGMEEHALEFLVANPLV